MNSAKRIRVGFAISHLSHGGAQRQLYELIRNIDRDSFQCFVYSLSETISPYGDMISQAGATLRALRRQSHFELNRILELATLLRRDRVDILHSFLFVANGYAWPARLLARVPHLITSARNCKEIGFLRGWANRIAFSMSDAVACNGNAVRSYVAGRYHIPLHRSVVIYNGLDLARFQTTGAPTGQSSTRVGRENPTVMTIGRLVPQKDLLLFLEAAALVVRHAPEVHFAIVGDGPCRADLTSRASANSLNGRIVFLGERSDVAELLASAEVFWLTSEWEGLPNVVLEAMACGKPVVARDVGSCHEVITHAKTGYLVDGRDAQKFADLTLDLLKNPLHAQVMGLAAKQVVADKFSVARMSVATEALYRSILRSPKRYDELNEDDR